MLDPATLPSVPSVLGISIHANAAFLLPISFLCEKAAWAREMELMRFTDTKALRCLPDMRNALICSSPRHFIHATGVNVGELTVYETNHPVVPLLLLRVTKGTMDTDKQHIIIAQ